MRHRKDGRQFGRNTPHRRAMFRNLAGNLITHERIVTTDAKAKELRRVTDRLITKAKRLGEVAYTAQDKLDADQKAKRLHVKRQLDSFLPRTGVDRDGDIKVLTDTGGTNGQYSLGTDIPYVLEFAACNVVLVREAVPGARPERRQIPGRTGSTAG